MIKFSLPGMLTVTLLLAAQSSFAGLNLSQVKQCISNEMDLVRVVHPLKAEYLRLEREGSVAELISMMKEDSEEIDSMSATELNGSQMAALTKELGQLKSVLDDANSCADARKAMLDFATVYEKKPLLSMNVFFEPQDHSAAELNEWNSEAKEQLKLAGYTKALSSISANGQPALTILLVSGETTSVLNEQFVLERDTTMRSALKAVVGDDAPAQVLEMRLAEKMRKESLKRLTDLLNSASQFVAR
ncbi:hypothetical protein B9G69_007775 [Bdellovibrio sp. SKB1291214]|uniref:hypothetical protein n=1 Tax=Bdellovibrio sp. SKB1291214 TaxID=1732569 RepID=UPI000B51A116|nr:hypothetical protein [Bdellovibrio sp. SKB1291214]UYL10474.1 hypothetical protein B9G69_007775 [Bdellovibrio sp. SKB1291214]